jgi:hypothetical protein
MTKISEQMRAHPLHIEYGESWGTDALTGHRTDLEKGAPIVQTWKNAWGGSEEAKSLGLLLIFSPALNVKELGLTQAYINGLLGAAHIKALSTHVVNKPCWSEESTELRYKFPLENKDQVESVISLIADKFGCSFPADDGGTRPLVCPRITPSLVHGIAG